MIEQLVTPHLWLQLDHATRQKFAEQFGLKRSGGPVAVTQNGITIVESDGYTVQDLRPLSVKAMQEFTGSTSTDLTKLMERCINKFATPKNEKV